MRFRVNSIENSLSMCSVSNDIIITIASDDETMLSEPLPSVDNPFTKVTQAHDMDK